MRRESICKIPESFKPTADSTTITKTYHLEIITPLLGGDAESWLLDPKSPVRTQSIKGHLRFWWRTMQDIENHTDLLVKENKMWGGKIGSTKESGSIQSPIKISCHNFNKSMKLKFKLSNKTLNEDDIPSNVSFPLISIVTKNPNKYDYYKKLSFDLTLEFKKEYQDQLNNTLKLWVLFGGIGARTRRGAGSLYCKELLKDFTSSKEIKEFVTNLVQDQSNHPMPYPRLAGMHFFAGSSNKDSQTSWKNLLKRYKSYRQSRNGKYGRSHWPEPDAIRLITKKYSSKHTPEHPDGQWFPRSAFGLPIITEFKDDSDPVTTTLMPESGERLPSPAIIKVIKLPNNKVLNCCIVLNQAFPEKLKLAFPEKLKLDDITLSGKQLPFFEGYQNKKIMRTKDDLGGQTICQNLAKNLGDLKEIIGDLEEVK